MKTRLQVSLIAVATTIVVALVLGILSALLERPTAHLANGTEVSLLGVTCGPTNIFFPGGLRDRLLYSLAGSKTLRIGPFKVAPTAPLLDEWRKENGTPAFPNRAVFWLGHSGPSNAPALPVPEEKWFAEIRATLSDETGEEWPMRAGTAIVRPAGVRGLNWVSSWDFTSFPRRGERLRFRLYAQKATDQWEVLADFRVQNPSPGPYPAWRSSPFPILATNKNLTVSLTRLVSGTRQVPYLSGPRPFTGAIFKVEEEGKPTEAWLPDQMEANDATGNEPWVPMVNYGATNGSVYYEMQNMNLSPSEIWRLRTRFVKQGPSSDDKTWTSPKLEVEGGTLSPMTLQTDFETFQLTLETTHAPFRNTIRLKLSPPAKNARLELSPILDDQGKRVEYESGGFEDFGFDAQWKIPARTEWVRFTIRLVETRDFEFMARPSRE